MHGLAKQLDDKQSFDILKAHILTGIDYTSKSGTRSGALYCFLILEKKTQHQMIWRTQKSVQESIQGYEQG